MSASLAALLPALVDAVILLSLAEAGALIWWYHRRGRGVAPRDFLLNLGSGLCLMLALRLALGGVGAPSVLLCLSAAGALHACELWRRWR